MTGILGVKSLSGILSSDVDWGKSREIIVERRKFYKSFRKIHDFRPGNTEVDMLIPFLKVVLRKLLQIVQPLVFAHSRLQNIQPLRFLSPWKDLARAQFKNIFRENIPALVFLGRMAETDRDNGDEKVLKVESVVFLRVIQEMRVCCNFIESEDLKLHNSFRLTNHSTRCYQTYQTSIGSRRKCTQHRVLLPVRAAIIYDSSSTTDQLIVSQDRLW
uniref:Uncharacterized protein n=1 Tax=Timema bartmani TaxID=61472 RepID=A0A7R9ER09_9NEOP|nr:unnamed protein product [Timema bartmani]